MLQTSSNNTATVTQGYDDPASDASWGNSSVINQIGIGGSNFAQIRQLGKIDDSTVTQSGTGGSAIVNQRDSMQFPSSDLSQVSFNSSTVTQSASSNAAIINQTGRNNSSTVGEAGNGNSARVTQTGNNNLSTVSLNAGTGGLALSGTYLGIQSLPTATSNSSGFAGVLQVGSRLESHITATGTSNFAFVNQVDSAMTPLTDISTIIQSGDVDLAFVGQIGTDLQSTIMQTGDGDYADVEQSGAGHRSNWTQSGDDNNANELPGLTLASANGVHQSGTGQISTISQSGNGGLVNVVQSNIGNSSLINQGGDNNTAFVTQSGLTNTSEIDQILGSSSNIATVVQASDSNFSSITQFGTNSTVTVTQGFTKN